MLCLSGGGIKGFSQLGALHYLYSEGVYDPQDIHTYAGTSIGSIIALLLNVGYVPMDIFIQASKIEKWMDFDIKDFLEFENDYGFLDIKNFSKIIGVLIQKKMGRIPTLLELYQHTGKRLVICVVNYTKKCPEYLDYQTAPYLSCLQAVEMSCSIPIVFKKIKWGDSEYVDGGVMNEFPIKEIDDGYTKILGVRSRGINDTTGMFSYIHNLFNLSVNESQRLRLETIGKNCTVVTLYHQGSQLSFTPSKEYKMKMFCEGYNQCETQCVENYVTDWNWEFEENKPLFVE